MPLRLPLEGKLSAKLTDEVSASIMVYSLEEISCLISSQKMFPNINTHSLKISINIIVRIS